jgi:hypothetical protein
MQNTSENSRRPTLGFLTACYRAVLFALLIAPVGCSPKPNPHEAMIQKLAEFESALEQGATDSQITSYMTSIGAEAKLHPLPESDKSYVDSVKTYVVIVQARMATHDLIRMKYGYEPSAAELEADAHRITQLRDALADLRAALQAQK